MKKALVLLSLVSILAASLPSFCQAQEKQRDTKQLLEEGIDLYRSGKYEEAINVFMDVLKLSVDKNEIVRTHLYSGYTYFAMNQPDKSLEQVEEAIKSAPDLKLNEEEFAPEFIKFFEAAKAQFVGTAFIESNPNGARVWINKREVGYTPLKIQLLAQKYNLKVVKGWFSPYEENIEMRNDAIVPFRIDFNKKKNWKSFVLSSLIMTAMTVLVKSL
jgi:tetratricopeptide (TPR) repeat protein